MYNKYEKLDYVGKAVTVRLPEGWPEFATVTIVSQDTGQFDVEYQGQKFRIAQDRITDLDRVF